MCTACYNKYLYLLPTQYCYTDGFRMILTVNTDYFPNSINQLITVMFRCCEVQQILLDELRLQMVEVHSLITSTRRECYRTTNYRLV